jgi:flavorubredoxin
LIEEIASNVYWLVVKDWSRRVFDALIPLPQGTSYNTYLIKGTGGDALIDTVNPGFEEQLVEKASRLTSPERLKYVVMNHAEPDHAGSIPAVLKWSDTARLVATDKGAKMAQRFYKVPEERVKTVGTGDIIDLGGKTLKFVEAPFIHWPETMITYLVEDGVLFPCDFFGAHTALGLYDDDVEDLSSAAKKYFGEIMMPYRSMAVKALEKVKELQVKVIAPSHGPIYKNPAKILKAYEQWTSGETKEKAVVVYVSMWRSTEAMASTMAETLLSEGVEVTLHDLLTLDVGELAGDLVDSRALVLGTPTVLGGMHPLALYAAHLLKALRPPLKYLALLVSYGWGLGASTQAQEILASMRVELVGSMEVNGPPTPMDREKIAELATILAEKIKGKAS